MRADCTAVLCRHQRGAVAMVTAAVIWAAMSVLFMLSLVPVAFVVGFDAGFVAMYLVSLGVRLRYEDDDA